MYDPESSHLFRNSYSSLNQFIYSLNKSILRNCQLSDSMLGAEIIAANKTYSVFVLIINYINKCLFIFKVSVEKENYLMG